MMNPHREDDRIRMMFTCAYSAVQTGFPHLAVKDIIKPPHGWFDALLARQIAIRIVGVDFGMPRRRMAVLLDCNRVRVSCSVVAVNKRLADPVFSAAYHRMATLALDLFAHETAKAAA